MNPFALPLVVVNALGQGPGFWDRLVDRLAPRPVLVQTMSGYGSDAGVTGLDDHVAELAEIVNVNRTPLHLLGWCTGAKVVMRHAARAPGGVRSVTLLSPSLRHPGRAPELDTDYERELDALCRMVVARPATADRVRRLLTRVAFDRGGAEPLTASALDEERKRPFATAESVTVYARQLIEFWSQDPAEDARRVSAPVLVISGADDAVVSGGAQRPVLDLVTGVEHHEISGGGHYLMHDQAALVAELLEGFLRRSESRQRSGVA